jgi:dTDP-4-dehydrorhamnose 3,5-epimerase-like enzyme
MSSQVTIEKVSFFADGRGWVIEPVDEPTLAAQRNVHVTWSEPGAIRGNHHHQHSAEVMLAMGPALVRWRENDQVREVTVPDGVAMRFTIPPGVAHAVQNTGSRPLVLVSFSDQPHDRANPDTIRDSLIES